MDKDEIFFLLFFFLLWGSFVVGGLFLNYTKENNDECSVFCYNSSPAVSKESLEDVGGSRRAEDGPFDTSVFEVAAVDLVGAQPLFDSLLDAVPLGEAHGMRSWGETVIHKVHRVLNKGGRQRQLRLERNSETHVDLFGSLLKL